MDLRSLSQKTINDKTLIRKLSTFHTIEANIILKSYFNMDIYDKCNYYDSYANVKKLLVEEKDLAIVKEIILHTKDEIDSSVNKNNLFHKAVIREDKELVNLCLECNLDVTNKNKQGYTPLHLATINKYISIIKLFLEHKKDISTLDNNGFSFLDYYDFSQSPSIMKLLLDNYNIVIEQNKEKFKSVFTQRDIYNMVMDNMVNEINNLSIRDIVNYNFENNNYILKLAIFRNKFEIVNCLINKNICIDDNFIIYEVVHSENASMLDLFINNDAYIMDEYDKFRMSFIEMASTTNPTIIKRLIEHGIDFYSKGYNNKYIIDYPILHYQFSIVHYLIYNCKDIRKYSYLDKDIVIKIYQRFHESEICKYMIVKNVIIPKENDLLHLASEQGNLDFVKYLLNKGFDINSFSSDLRTPLSYAVIANKINVVNYLISQGADVNLYNIRSPLHKAIENDNIRMVQCLLDNRANIEAIDCDRNTPLMVAIKEKKREIVNLLIERNANVNAVNKNKNVLITAIQYFDFLIVERLIEAGADVNANNSLFYAVKKVNSSLTKLLLDHGANPNIVDDFNKSPLYYSVEYDIFKTFQYLIEYGSILDLQDKDIIFSGLKKHVFIKYFLEHGLDVNIKSNTNYSLLYHAFEIGNLLIIKTLLEHGANLNEEIEEQSYMFYAIKLLNNELVSFLIEKGFDVNQRDRDGNTPLIYLLKQSNIHKNNYMIQYTLDKDFCYTKCHDRYIDEKRKNIIFIMKILLENKADINLKNNANETALSIAINSDEFSLSEYFIKMNDFKIRKVTIHSRYDYYRLGYYDIVDYLVDHGADVNALNEYNETLFSASMRYIPSNILVKMIEHGANLNVVDYHKNTPLEQAIKRNDSDLIFILKT